LQAALPQRVGDRISSRRKDEAAQSRPQNLGFEVDVGEPTFRRRKRAPKRYATIEDLGKGLPSGLLRYLHRKNGKPYSTEARFRKVSLRTAL